MKQCKRRSSCKMALPICISEPCVVSSLSLLENSQHRIVKMHRHRHDYHHHRAPPSYNTQASFPFVNIWYSSYMLHQCFKYYNMNKLYKSQSHQCGMTFYLWTENSWHVCGIICEKAVVIFLIVGFQQHYNDVN